ncbi:MAG: 3-phosphoshikimate 1-carboxyvinyltransferase [Mariprofundaceae bacterium]
MSHSTLIAGPSAVPLAGTLKPPGDKSISHRIVILASLAEGITKIDGFLPGEDNLATAAMFEAMGTPITWLNEDKTRLRIEGRGLHGLREPSSALDAGNSGTCVRLMAGVLAGQSFASTLTGDASLRRRPMMRVVAPLRRMGVRIDGPEDGALLPLTIRGGELAAIHHISQVASAQVKSCVLLAGLFAQGETSVSEPSPSRDHTEKMLASFGQPVDVRDDAIVLKPCGRLRSPEGVFQVPADPSSACFFAVAASLLPGSNVRLAGIGINPRRDGWRRILEQMGAQLVLEDERTVGLEPVADVLAGEAQLRGIRVNRSDVADAIDEFPVLFVAAALSSGEFVLRDAAELRTKESDRISIMARALTVCGVELQELPDGIRIRGRDTLGGNVRVDAADDHRIAMAMAVAAQRADGDIFIEHAEAIATSFPDFVPMAQSLGMNVRWADD